MSKGVILDVLWKKSYSIGILWSPIAHRWLDILRDINKEGVILHHAYEYRPICNSTIEWQNFVINCYLSHEKLDNPAVDLNSKIQKLYRKINHEHLNQFPQHLCVVLIEVKEPKKVEDIICTELREKWGYTDERIVKNKEGLIRKNCPYELNLIKDIIRKRFHDDKELLPYTKGAYAGRKRIMHTPVSHEGCQALFDFLLNYPHNVTTIKT